MHNPAYRSSAQLTRNAIQFWQLPLSLPADELAEMAQTLSLDERERASTFRFDEHRRWFVAGRGQLRQVLAGYLGCAPREIEFRYSAYGKPKLAGCGPELPIEFNLAHSADKAILAVTLESRLGADLEQVRPLDDLAGVARSAFSDQECSELFSLGPLEQTAAFFRVWTGKEAVLKALGTGFSLPSRSFSVSVFPGDTPRLTSAPEGAGPASGWTLQDVPTFAGFAAAIAVDRGAVNLDIQGISP